MRFWHKRSADAVMPQTPDPITGVTPQEYQHRGYRALFFARGEGWRVDIYKPGSKVCELVVSYDGAPAACDVVADDIKHIIDGML